MGNFYTIHAASKILGVTPQTLRNWDKTGKLKPHHTSANGYRYYSQEQIDAFLRVAKKAERIVIGYCRVSSAKQKDDLKRQEEAVRAYLIAQGSPFEIITDIGSGINYTPVSNFCGKVSNEKFKNSVRYMEICNLSRL